MKKESPWFRPAKTPGEPSVRTHQHYPPDVVEALRRIALRETAKYGIRVSPANILTTYALRNEAFRKQVDKIKQEHRHEQQPDETPTSSDFSE